MKTSTTMLPDGFTLRREINLQKDQALLIKLNLWGLVLVELMWQPATAMVQDRGDMISVYMQAVE